MSLTPGTRLGGYVAEERLGESASGERWAASEPGAGRRAILTVTPLPDEPAEREGARERLRRLAAIEHPSLLPVYDAGEEEGQAWMASRAPAGRTLASAEPLSAEAAGRLSESLRSAVAALAAAGLAPSTVRPEDVVIEGAQAYLVPSDHDGGDDSAAALAAIDRLPMPLDSGRRRRRILVAASLGVLAIAVVVTLVLWQSQRDDGAVVADTPVGEVVARIPLGVRQPSAIAAAGGWVWVASERGLLRVDARANTVVGSPMKSVMPASPHGLAASGGSLYVADGRGVLRLDASSGRVLDRTALPGAVGVAASARSLAVAIAPLRPDRRGGRFKVAWLGAADLRTIASTTPRNGGFVVAIDERASWSVGQGNTVEGVGRSAGLGPVYVGSELTGAVLTDDALWIASPRDQTVISVDPIGGRLAKVVSFDDSPAWVSADEDSVWVYAMDGIYPRPNVTRGRLHRIDRATARLVGEPLELQAAVGIGGIGFPIAAAEGSVWLVEGQDLVRVAPSSGLEARSEEPGPTDVLAVGPITQVGKRLRTQHFAFPLSLIVPSERWFHEIPRQPDFVLLKWTPLPTHSEAYFGIDAPRQVFDAKGGLHPVRTAKTFVAAVRANPGLAVGPARRTSVGGVPALEVEISARPLPADSRGCGYPCTNVYPLDDTTFSAAPGPAQPTTIVERGGRVLVIPGAPYNLGPAFRREVEQIIDSIRFEDE